MMKKMKDSGIEWCGMIPEHWEVMPNKYVMYKSKEVCSKYTGQNILSLTMDGVIVRDLDAGGKMPATFDGYQVVHPNNLLMCLFDYDVTPRCIGLIKDEGLTSPAYSQFVMKNGNSSSYYYYYYLMIDNTKELLHLAKNLRHSFTEEQLGAINAPVPPISEQKEIAEFLDAKIPEVNAIIIKTKESIEQYRKYKQAVITHAIVKGLDDTVSMKDSGIEWVGKIPENWDVMRITYIRDEEHPYALGDGDHGTIKTEDYADEGIPYIRVQNLGWCSELKMDNVVYITEEDNKKIQNSTLRPNDVLFVKTGGTIGKTAIIPESIQIANTTSHVGKLTVSSKYNAKYILYVLGSYVGYKQFWDIASLKTTRPELAIDEIKTIKLLVPSSRNIQDEIVNYLDAKCAEIDALIAKKEAFVEEMEAYKKSLIYEYVTGKKEVL